MASESVATRSLGWTVNASIAKNAPAVAASVAARPSMLSSRLKAFVIPTSHTAPITAAAVLFGERVEGFRHPAEPPRPDHGGGEIVRDDLDVDSGEEDERGRDA